MLIESHRGMAVRYPENTMAAFYGAFKEGYHMVELDPKFTSDGCPVILHDPTLNRTGRDKNGNAPEKELKIHEMTLAETREYEFGSWFSPEFKGEKLPELKDVLAFALETRMPLKFDNVWHSFSAKEQDRFLSEIAVSPAREYCELTCMTTEAVEKAVKAIDGVKIHYDGFWRPEVKDALSALLPKERLTVWRRMDNARTAWCSVPPVTLPEAEDIHTMAKLGLWLLTEQEELKQARVFGADIVETDGSLRPV